MKSARTHRHRHTHTHSLTNSTDNQLHTRFPNALLSMLESMPSCVACLYFWLLLRGIAFCSGPCPMSNAFLVELGIGFFVRSHFRTLSLRVSHHRHQWRQRCSSHHRRRCRRHKSGYGFLLLLLLLLHFEFHIMSSRLIAF